MCLQRRDEYSTRGDRRSPCGDALLRPVPDQQPVSDGLRQPGEGQPRRSPGDGPAEGQAAGEAGVHHGGSAGQRQQQLLLNAPISGQLSCSSGASQQEDFSCPNTETNWWNFKTPGRCSHSMK